VLGRQFTYQELLAVSGQSGTGLLDVMDGLLERNLIRELDGGELLAFSHADIQRTIYDDLDDERQRALHQEVGAALEKLYEESLGQNASRLAHHFIRAGDKANGLTYGLMAAQQACSIYAFQNALYWFNQVVRLLPEGENHLAERIILHEGLGTIFQVQANYTDARLAFDTMEKTAGKAGDKAAQGRALIGLAGVQDDLGDHRGALGTIRRAIQLAQEARDDENMLKGLAVQGWVYLNLGDYSSARMVGERALIISRKLGVDHEVARHLNLLGMVHVSLGDYQRSENYLQEAYVMYRGLRDRDYQGRVLNNLGENARRRGDYEKANRYFNEALAVAREIGNLDAEITFMNNLGGAQVGAGEYAEGERNLREVLQMVEVSGWSHTTETYIYLAEACLWQDKFDDALAAGEKAIALGQEREQLEYVGRAWRALGVIARETRNPVTIPERTGGVTNGRTGELARRGYSGKFRKYEPNECFMKSMRIFDELGLQAERARTLREWAKLDQRVGDAETARRRWEEAISLFQQLGMEAEAARMSIAAGY
jgi:tetratricopeptide (TPR) repeat protein